MEAELGRDRAPFADRVVRGAVHDPEQDAAALDVAQERVSQALALVRALDQAGHIGHDHRADVARASSSSSPSARTPRFGVVVVNGYGPTSGRAAVSAARSVDLPAFGAPTKPMSAMSFSSSSIHPSSPGSPRS